MYPLVYSLNQRTFDYLIMKSSLEEISYDLASIHQNDSIISIDGFTSQKLAYADYERNLAWLQDDYKLQKAVVVNVGKWDLCGQFEKE